MNKKLGFLIAIPILFLIVLLAGNIEYYFTNYGFEEIDTSVMNDSVKADLEGDSEADLTRNLMSFAGSEGDFVGSVKTFRFREKNEYVVVIRNDYVPDDSVSTTELRFTARRNNDGSYQVIKYERRAECSDISLLGFFTSPAWDSNSIC